MFNLKVKKKYPLLFFFLQNITREHISHPFLVNKDAV